MLLQPVGQRPPGIQHVSLGNRAGPLGVFVTECVEQLLMLVERMLFVIGEQAAEVARHTADEIARAEANVAAYREAEAKGRGAVGVNGVLVDAAHVKMAEETLARAALINGSRGQ
jgi:hypothetical protein